MKKWKHYVGIDISKLTFDAAVIVNDQTETMQHRQFAKTAEGLTQFQQWLFQKQVLLNDQTMVCMEYTGLYNRKVLDFLEQTGVAIWVEMAAHIKKSLGLQRDKSDKLDAQRIADFAWRHADKARHWSSRSSAVQRIKDLLAQRDRLVDTKTRLQVPLQEIKQEGLEKSFQELNKLQQPIIKKIEQGIAQIEKTIQNIVQADEELKTKSALIQSVKGVGPIICWYLLSYTNGFLYLDKGKSLACYCGVVPFKNTSGTTIKSKPRVSPIANKKLKSLMNLAALSAIKHDKEIKYYYERKVMEGKNKMSVLNAVRNKLILRITAVVRDNRKFEDNYVRKAA